MLFPEIMHTKHGYIVVAIFSSLKSISFASTCYLAFKQPKAHSIGLLGTLLNLELKTISSFDLHEPYSFVQFGSNGYAVSKARYLGIVISLLLIVWNFLGRSEQLNVCNKRVWKKFCAVNTTRPVIFNIHKSTFINAYSLYAKWMELFVTEITVRVFRKSCKGMWVPSIHPKAWITQNLVLNSEVLYFFPWFTLGRCKYLGPTYNTIALQISFITAKALLVAIPKLLSVMLNVPQSFFNNTMSCYNVTPNREYSHHKSFWPALY